MIILGIDPGTATVGWGVIDTQSHKIQAAAFGHIATSPKLSPSKRLLEISEDITKIVKKFAPEEAAVEELFFFKNQKTVVAVAEARGSILLTLESLHVKVASYTPLEVKQSLTNYGRADKYQVQLMVKSILKLGDIPKPDDAADALAIALCHAHRRKMENILNSKNL